MSFWEKMKGGKWLKVGSVKKDKLHRVKSKKTNKRKPVAAKQRDTVTVWMQDG